MEISLVEHLTKQHVACRQYTYYKSAIINEVKFSIGDSLSYKVKTTPIKSVKEFAYIVAIVLAGDHVAFLTKCYRFAEPRIDVDQTEFHSLELTSNFKVYQPNAVCKEQVVTCDNCLLVNFYYHFYIYITCPCLIYLQFSCVSVLTTIALSILIKV